MKTKTPTFTDRFNALTKEALKVIYNYKGKKIETLTDGSLAIDNDDSWIIVGYEDDNDGAVYVRDKRNQGHFNRGNYSAEELHMEDDFLEDCMDEYEIYHLADSLMNE